MLVKEYLSTMMFGMVKSNDNHLSIEQMREKYWKRIYILPRIYCNDGFNISVQVHNGSYSRSENGIREFGLEWKLVEWGFPSEEIDGEKFNCEGWEYYEEDEKPKTTESVGGFVNIDKIEGLVAEHGGFDLMTTLQKEMESNKVVKKPKKDIDNEPALEPWMMAACL